MCNPINLFAGATKDLHKYRNPWNYYIGLALGLFPQAIGEPPVIIASQKAILVQIAPQMTIL